VVEQLKITPHLCLRSKGLKLGFQLTFEKKVYPIGILFWDLIIFFLATWLKYSCIKITKTFSCTALQFSCIQRFTVQDNKEENNPNHLEQNKFVFP
jgi:hypothetical protein